MTHVTLNTGDTVTQPRSKVLPGTIEAMQVLLPAGGNLGNVAAMFSAFRVEITKDSGAAAFTVYRGREPIVLNVVCWDAAASAASWASIEHTYLRLAEVGQNHLLGVALPERPATTPWLGTVLSPFIGTLIRDDILWLGDFEHCLAVALSEAK